jgi:hypothetical protein
MRDAYVSRPGESREEYKSVKRAGGRRGVNSDVDQLRERRNIGEIWKFVYSGRQTWKSMEKQLGRRSNKAKGTE